MFRLICFQRLRNDCQFGFGFGTGLGVLDAAGDTEGDTGENEDHGDNHEELDQGEALLAVIAGVTWGGEWHGDDFGFCSNQDEQNNIAASRSTVNTALERI